MDAHLYVLIANYGFKSLHTRLMEVMKEEYDFLHSHFAAPPVNVVCAESQIPTTVNSTNEIPMVQEVPVIQEVKEIKETQKKVRKYNVRKNVKVAPVPVESSVIVALNPEVKDVVVTAPAERNGYRDPKEVKAYQKASEDERRKLNEKAGIQISQVLTKENLKQWIEVEGRTYAWVAREKAGCADTQVAATAQMMGVKSTISKKRGIMMGNS